ncbi:MAG: hydantoinase B/oxoprolinase family protein [Cyclobacteriaceae bacterium]
MSQTTSQSTRWKISIDTGGTFTDCIATDPEGKFVRVKVLSSSRLRGVILNSKDRLDLEVEQSWPVQSDIFAGYHFHLLGTDYSARITSTLLESGHILLSDPLPGNTRFPASFEITAGEEAPVLATRLLTGTPLQSRIPPVDMRLGTTRGTNALLERKGAKTALLVTKGFEDLLVIGNQQRPDLFSLDIQKSRPLTTICLGIPERLDKSGKALIKPEEAKVDEVISKLKAKDIESVAVCLLHSYRNSTHEKELGEKLQQAGIPFISLSSCLSPTIKVLNRAETAVVNAYLTPVISNYLQNIKQSLPESRLLVMTSAGGLNHLDHFKAKDSLLSGPAGGVAGAAFVGKQAGIDKLLTLDMGGTSTDVARYDETYDYSYELSIAGTSLATPTLAIETVAAGGGSICAFDGYGLTVGPQSAGARPGPACYGADGPLTLTDINLLLGRTDPDSFAIPLKEEAARQAFEQVLSRVPDRRPQDILQGFLQIANEKMAEAIRQISQRKGYDPSEYALLGFGGAGGQHACQVADLLGISKVIIPADAGILSAVGISTSEVSRIVQLQVLKPLSDFDKSAFDTVFEELKSEGKHMLMAEGEPGESLRVGESWLYMRLKGQETSIEIPFTNDPYDRFVSAYKHLYGHYLEGRTVEVESIKLLVVSARSDVHEDKEPTYEKYTPTSAKELASAYAGNTMPVYQWCALQSGASLSGPALLVSDTCTAYLDQGWDGLLDHKMSLVLIRNEGPSQSKAAHAPEVQLSLFTNRFSAIAREMGAMLERTSFSVNVKERLDFSCALLDSQGRLVVNAPHIPVHLGSMGLCVRTVLETYKLEPGDIIITNHPAYGGSHLPDITLIAPVYDSSDTLLGYLANRAHHAELGGKSPGSMPPDADSLQEEGVVISPAYLFKSGVAKWEEIEKILTDGPYPSRNSAENLADLRGAVASLRRGAMLLLNLAGKHSPETVIHFMNKLRVQAADSLKPLFTSFEGKTFQAIERLDDGHELHVSMAFSGSKLQIDFTGTSAVHPRNYNATPAIVRSVIIYVLRLLSSEQLPLNEGLMEDVEVCLPEGMLNPHFPDAPEKCPAVVGGNTEVSQRLTDTLLKALSLAACSQGTMNNIVFGTSEFGYYETIAGGTGAGSGFHGASAVHQHMTNTRITDPEVIEWRYPVRIDSFAVRKNSGGDGRFRGGDGLIRIITFLEDVDLTILAQHRQEAPYGLQGGDPGAKGNQYLVRKDNSRTDFPPDRQQKIKKGDTVVIETPGGGGYGEHEKVK